MQSGKKDQPIFIQRPITSQDDFGAVIQQWVDISGNSPATPFWAYVISQKGNESFESARLNARETIRICIYYNADIDTSYRIVWENQTYHVKYIDKTARRAGDLWITAELVGAE